MKTLITISSVQSLSHIPPLVTPWITAHQDSLSITNSRSSLKLMFINSVMPSSHLILCCPLLLLKPIPPSIRAFSNESTLHMRWPKYWSFGFRISPSNEDPGLISFRMDMGSERVGHDWSDLAAAASRRKLSTEELMLLNCGVEEDSCESLGLQGDPTSPS